MSQSPAFFTEWLEAFTLLSEEERHLLDRVKANFQELMEEPPMLENTVKMVVLEPLLDLAGLYHKPFRIETETSVALEMKDEGAIIRGRIDVLVRVCRIKAEPLSDKLFSHFEHD
jgi:hypothetical protein